MATETTLTATKRSEHGSGPAGRLRRDGLVPAVVYGLGTDTVPVTVPAHELQRILTSQTGVNTLITLDIEGDQQLTFARQIQRNPVKGTLVHVDFVRVRADVAVTAEVAIHLVGEPAGVDFGGRLEQLMFGVSIEAKPADIPVAIEHDVSALGLGDGIRIEDLAVPEGVTLLDEPDALVAQVVVPRGTAEEEAEGEEAEGEGAEGAEEGGGEAAE